MKSSKLATFGVIAAGLVATAQAQTVVRFSASNGDRNATQKAIGQLLSNWSYRGHGGTGVFVTAQNPTGVANFSVPSSVTGSNFGIWRGTWNGQTVIIKTNFAGALAGIAAVAGNIDQRFIPGDAFVDPGDANDPDRTAVTVTPIAGNAQAGIHYEIGKSDFGFSTNFQSTSPFEGLFGTPAVNYLKIDEEIVGVSPLGFYASPGFPATNVTIKQLQYLYRIGHAPLALFTGNWDGPDATNAVYAIGRNTDAGQRFGTNTEIGIGTSGTVKHWDPRALATNHPDWQPGLVGLTGFTPANAGAGVPYQYGGTVETHRPWPAETISNIFTPLGSGGFDGGATLAPFLTVTISPAAAKGPYYNEETEQTSYLYPQATTAYYIGYLTPGDARQRVLDLNEADQDAGNIPNGNQGVALSYNGVPLTNANVKNGLYTAWLYNRFLRPKDENWTSTPTAKSFSFALRDYIRDSVAGTVPGGLFHDETFKVSRAADGALITPR
jgi:hypothetical protein